MHRRNQNCLFVLTLFHARRHDPASKFVGMLPFMLRTTMLSKAFWGLMVAVSLACGSAVLADEVRVGQLILTETFRLSNPEQLPRPFSPYLLTERIDYPDLSAAEWQIRLVGSRGGEPKRIDDTASANFEVQFPSNAELSLHWSKGSHAEVTDFQPQTVSLTEVQPFVLESVGGRSSDGVMPYFNVATDGGGLILAVGWPGDWQASFAAVGPGCVRVVAGLKHAQLSLAGHEEQWRLPSILLMSYRGDWLDGQNQFRRLMLKHFTPKTHETLSLMPVAASVHGMMAFNDTTEHSLTTLAAEIAQLKLPIDTFWLDAGWNEGGFPAAQGNPNPDPVRFPRGLGPVGDVVRRTGMRFLVWFEPERAMRGTWLDREHSSWLLKPSRTTDEMRYLEKDGFRLLDLRNAEARQWALASLSKEIEEADISIYRQDFNESPFYFWHTEIPAEQVGMMEVSYINGLYAFLDELAKRQPGLILDNCASGGRRLDFEMMRRCVVLWRSDSCWGDPTYPRNVQAMTHGLSHWIPLHGLGAASSDEAALRSGMGVCASFAINYRDPEAVGALRKHLERYLKVRSLFAADFYPLTDWTVESNKLLAFQFHRSETDHGVIQAFQNAPAGTPPVNLKLRGLKPDRKYVLSDWDHPAGSIEKSGDELMNTGIRFQGNAESTAVVLEYTGVP